MGYVFVAPWMLGFLAFFLFPMVFSLVLAFSHVSNLQNFSFIYYGLKNFSNALLVDVEFVPKLVQSLTDALVKTPLIVVFSLLIAILLNQKLPGKGLLRALFLLPVVIGSGVVLQTLQGNSATLAVMDSMSAGAASAQQSAMELGNIELSGRMVMLMGEDFASAVSAVLQQVSDGLWMSGIQIVLFLGALQSVPDVYYEAAMCDGATGWEKFWKITLPMVTPMILIVVVYTVISYFTGAENQAMVYIVDTSFTNLELDYGSAMGWLYYSVIGLVLGLIFLGFRRFAFYAGDR